MGAGLADGEIIDSDLVFCSTKLGTFWVIVGKMPVKAAVQGFRGIVKQWEQVCSISLLLNGFEFCRAEERWKEIVADDWRLTDLILGNLTWPAH